MGERYLRHDFFERAVHWVMALSVILLIPSGLDIRFPGLIPWGFGTMNSARFIHFVSMYALIFSWLAYTIHLIVDEFKTEIIRWSDIKGLPEMVRHYLFLTEKRPAYPKYNPLQKLAFNIVWVMILIQAATGAMLYWPALTMGITSYFGGLMAVRVLHDFMTYIFISFIIIHIYLVLSSDIRNLWAMINGYSYR
ncbi:MAG: cytochrome b/b6 domain-containing protein [Deltaproteobacteria bacterium]|nr:cytochrome b/b6 domain-containing protein [Deltaproteobacteria bacterium]